MLRDLEQMAEAAGVVPGSFIPVDQRIILALVEVCRAAQEWRRTADAWKRGDQFVDRNMKPPVVRLDNLRDALAKLDQEGKSWA